MIIAYYALVMLPIAIKMNELKPEVRAWAMLSNIRRTREQFATMHRAYHIPTYGRASNNTFKRRRHQ